MSLGAEYERAGPDERRGLKRERFTVLWSCRCGASSAVVVARSTDEAVMLLDDSYCKKHAVVIATFRGSYAPGKAKP